MSTETTPREEDGFASREEFEEAVRRSDPEHAHTLEWGEHPDGWDRACYCDMCLYYGAR